MTREFISLKEARQVLKLSESTIKKIIKKNSIPTQRAGRFKTAPLSIDKSALLEAAAKVYPRAGRKHTQRLSGN